jgi:hypothetical protein
VAYDNAKERIYAILYDDTVIVYTCANSNPAQLRVEWTPEMNAEKITCMIGARLKVQERSIFYLICGTLAGQIVALDLSNQGKQVILSQVNSSNIYKIGSRVWSFEYYT